MIPGEYILKKEDILCNKGLKTIKVFVTNKGDRPVQVGSHYHFYEINSLMDFDREKARGMRLNIPSGTAVRFEPSEEKQVELVEISGAQIIHGFKNKINGKL